MLSTTHSGLPLPLPSQLPSMGWLQVIRKNNEKIKTLAEQARQQQEIEERIQAQEHERINRATVKKVNYPLPSGILTLAKYYHHRTRTQEECLSENLEIPEESDDFGDSTVYMKNQSKEEEEEEEIDSGND